MDAKSTDQYFLTNPELIREIIAQADLQPDDTVTELGAGIGSFARYLPVSRLTLVESDATLAAGLQSQFPAARVICGDAVTLLPQLSPLGTLFSHLPWYLTDAILQQLQSCHFRVALVAAPAGYQIPASIKTLHCRNVLQLLPQHFSPPQPYRTDILLCCP